MSPSAVTLADAVRFLTLPRELGKHPESGNPVTANVGRYGPYVAHDGEFRSIKSPDDPYIITFEKALALLAEPKKPPKGAEIVREIGKHPKTKKPIVLYKSKSGYFFKKGLRRILLPQSADIEKLTLEEAVSFLS